MELNEEKTTGDTGRQAGHFSGSRRPTPQTCWRNVVLRTLPVGAALVLRRQAIGALPYPVFLLAGSELVEVEHRFPARLRFPELGDRGAAPNAALVVLVLPEVVEEPAQLGDRRDAFLRGHAERSMLNVRC